jgi:hypothetical protein
MFQKPVVSFSSGKGKDTCLFCGDVSLYKKMGTVTLGNIIYFSTGKH